MSYLIKDGGRYCVSTGLTRGEEGHVEDVLNQLLCQELWLKYLLFRLQFNTKEWDRIKDIYDFYIVPFDVLPFVTELISNALEGVFPTKEELRDNAMPSWNRGKYTLAAELKCLLLGVYNTIHLFLMKHEDRYSLSDEELLSKLEADFQKEVQAVIS